MRHFLERPDDDALPVVAAIATLPMVLADGTILSGPGLMRERGIMFRIPQELLALLPARDDCTDDAVAQALAFLTDIWLCDVTTDFTGKCHTDRCRADFDRAVAAARSAGILCHGRTPRRRQDHHPHHAIGSRHSFRIRVRSPCLKGSPIWGFNRRPMAFGGAVGKRNSRTVAAVLYRRQAAIRSDR